MTVKRGRGRPPTGVKVQVRIPDEMLDVINAKAGGYGVSRSEMIRTMIRWQIESGRG